MEEAVIRRKRLIILAALWGSVVAVLALFHAVVIYFATAALIAYLVAPLVDRIGRLTIRGKSVPRWAAILFIYACFFFLVYLAIIALVPQLYRELARISRDAVEYANALTPERVAELAAQAEAFFTERGFAVDLGGDDSTGLGLSLDLHQLLLDVAAKTRGLVQEHLGDIVTISRTIVGGVLAAVFMLFFMLMLAAYMSIDASAIKGYAKSLLPQEYADDVRVLIERIDRSLSGVVRGQVMICLVNGILTFIGLVIFGVKFAFLLATVAALFSLIPIFGSIISSVPIVAIGLSQSWKTGLGMLLWIIGIHALEAYFLNPKIMGSAARIHPIIVAFALIAGERTFGLLGALFAVPIAAIFVACFDFARLKAQAMTPTPEPAPVPVRKVAER